MKNLPTILCERARERPLITSTSQAAKCLQINGEPGSPAELENAQVMIVFLDGTSRLGKAYVELQI